VLLHGTHLLPDGRRVRVRLPLAADRGAVHGLLHELGIAADDLELRRALRCDPGRQAAVVAAELERGRQRIAGFGALDVRSGALTLVAPPELRALLVDELREQSETWSRRVA
jgi:hypothetical protein